MDISEAEVLARRPRAGRARELRALRGARPALGGEVAATRAVVDAGWYPYAAQVGQTGKTVSPRLYVACGISGAIQHKVGMAGAETIVAINKDSNAPIFDFADLGVVGDVHQVLPRLSELVRAATRFIEGALVQSEFCSQHDRSGDLRATLTGAPVEHVSGIHFMLKSVTTPTGIYWSRR